jgi:hypothetical protein
LAIYVIAFLGRFLTRGVQKHDKRVFFPKKSIWALQKMWLVFPPFSFFSPSVVLLDFLSRFRAFRNKRSNKKTPKKYLLA